MSRPPWSEELLETIEEFGAASLGLVAWELSLSQVELEPAWKQAISDGLIEPVGISRVSGEEMYAPGRSAQRAAS